MEANNNNKDKVAQKVEDILKQKQPKEANKIKVNQTN